MPDARDTVRTKHISLLSNLTVPLAEIPSAQWLDRLFIVNCRSVTYMLIYRNTGGIKYGTFTVIKYFVTVEKNVEKFHNLI